MVRNKNVNVHVESSNGFEMGNISTRIAARVCLQTQQRCLFVALQTHSRKKINIIKIGVSYD